MTRRPWRAGATAAALLGLAACSGGSAPPDADNASDTAVPDVAEGSPSGLGAGQASDADVVSLDASQVDPNAGATPMKDRVAVLGLLNKRNGATRELSLKPGQATRIGDVVIRLRACERTAPWEADQYTGAFVQVDVQEVDRHWHRVFSGWLYKERAALNVVQHPIYDVWPKSCAMTFPDKGAGTVAAAAGESAPAAGKRSSAKKSPSTTGTPNASPAEEAPSAAPSNAT